MITFLLVAFIVVFGGSLGVSLYMCLELLNWRGAVIVERVEVVVQTNHASMNRWELLRLVVAYIAVVFMLFLALAVPLFWGVVSQLLIDRFSVGLLSVCIGLSITSWCRKQTSFGKRKQTREPDRNIQEQE